MPLRHFLIGIVMLAASGAAVALKPTQKLAATGPHISLGIMIPEQFGEWKIDETIALIANVVRVVILVVVTYYFGDEAGQGFIHGFAGFLLFIISLLFLFALDGVLGWIIPDHTQVRARLKGE